jgi:hypothetical protein
MVPLTDLHSRAARACIAAAVASHRVPALLGAIRLRDDQRDSAGRVLAALERDGGCVLADDVGTGKTYVALAIARSWARPLIVVPASLRSTWLGAMVRAGVRCEITSHETLSRGRVPDGFHDLVIVDESHRFRSMRARRHAVLASLCASARVLMLSATPLQNHPRDLAAQVALFHGARAFRLPSITLARFVVRGAPASDPDLPTVAPPIWVRPAVDDQLVLRQILALPVPPAPADGGDAGVLRTIGLVRAWASSRAALADMLRRRRRVATAIEQCIADGLLPTRDELRTWLGTDSAIQLGFPALLVSGIAPADGALRQADLEREQQALAQLLHAVRSHGDADAARARALLAICAEHPDARVLAFSEFASTARAYHALLAHRAGVGLLTSRDARIASGRLTREELLSRFAPRARNAPLPPAHERVRLLIATDLLSEGVNLQDASVVVHLDLPWNPARLAQRVGRVRRPGGSSIVHAYLIAPPANASLLLDVEQRLRRKLASSAVTIGRGIDVVPRLAELPIPAETPPDGAASVRGETMTRIAGWRRPTRRDHRKSRPLVAGVESESPGWLAALDDGRIIAEMDGRPADAISSVAMAARLCEGPGVPLDVDELERCMLACRHRIDAERLARMCGWDEAPSELAGRVEHCIAETLRSAPRHERAMVSTLARRLRGLVRTPRPLGLERALERLLSGRESSSDIRWMHDAHDLASRVETRADRDWNPSIVGMIVLGTIR